MGNIGTDSNHDWNEDTVKQYGNDRCKNCGIQYEYYTRGIRDMNSWTKDDIASDKAHYETVMGRYKVCVPR